MSNDEKSGAQSAGAQTVGSSGAWPDLYALLNVPADSDAEVLRKRIREAYAEATANSDHRNIDRRQHYQAMMERVLPQCRRILLEPSTRAAYDRQSALHQQKSPGATEYARFVNTMGAGETDAGDADALTALGKADELTTRHEPRENEVAQARAVLQAFDVNTQDDLGATALSVSDTGVSDAGVAAPAFGSAANADPKRAPDEVLSSGESPNAVGASTAAQAAADKDAADSNAAAPAGPTWMAARRPRSGPAATTSGNGASTFGTSQSKNASAPTLPGETQTAVVPPHEYLSPRPTAQHLKNAASTTMPMDSSNTTGSEPNNPATVAHAVDASGIVASGSAAATSSGNAAASPDVEAQTGARMPEAATVSSGAATISSGAQAVVATTQNMADSQATQEPLKEEHFLTAQVLPRTPYEPRVSVGDTAPRARSGRKIGRPSSGDGNRVLSQTSRLLLTAIAAALLTFFIIRPDDRAAVVRVPLRVSFASELEPFMQRARRDFMASGEGAGVEVQLTAVDARDGMLDALGKGGFSPDVWIPSESLWSERFNQVAAQRGRPIIKAMRSLTLSPTVLIARSDHSAELKRRFPDHTIPSWEALRQAIGKGAPGHLGLTDPNKSGSGAITRVFMAREWCEKNRVPWNAQAMKTRICGNGCAVLKTTCPVRRAWRATW